MTILAIAQMVRDLSTGTPGSMVVEDENGLANRIVSVAGDFEDHETFLQFGAFHVAMDNNACSPESEITIKPAPDAGGDQDVKGDGEGSDHAASEGDEDGAPGRRLCNPASSRSVAAAIFRNEKSTVLKKNCHAYAIAHDAIRQGRKVKGVKGSDAEIWVSVVMGMSKFFQNHRVE